MIKKAGNIAIIFILLVATGGLPITRHYCGNAEMSFSVYSTPKSCCNGHCDKCHNVFKFTKVTDSFENGSSVSPQDLSEIVITQASLFTDLSFLIIETPLSTVPIFRADFNLKAGNTPASLGNFRC